MGYQDDVDVAVANVPDTWAEIDPSKILQKIRLHLETHLREDILRFGPLVGVCTEGFESFNAVFWHRSVLSNHLAPSRDIAGQLADQEGLKHRLSGGWWQKENGDWVSAGHGVQDMAQRHPMMQRSVGWTTPEISFPGELRNQTLFLEVICNHDDPEYLICRQSKARAYTTRAEDTYSVRA